MEQLNKAQTHEALRSLDLKTLHASASIVSQIGFQHYGLSQDTRIAMEARKAHRFVALNCEEAARKILMLSGGTAEDIDAEIKRIADQIVAFEEHRKNKTKIHLAGSVQ